MNHTELRALVRTLTDIYATELVTDARITFELNQAGYELGSLFDWPQLEGLVDINVVADQNEYDDINADSTFRHVLSVAYTEGTFRTLLPQWSAATLAESTDFKGVPRAYVVDEIGTITLYPTPVRGATLSVRIQQTVPALVEDTDTPPWRVEYHSALAYGAATRLLSTEADDSGRAQSYQNEYNNMIQRMHRDYLTSRDRGNVQLGARRRRPTRRIW